MPKIRFAKLLSFSALSTVVIFSIACQPQTSTTNANLVNTNANIANSFANTSANSNSMNMSGAPNSAIETREPEQYTAKVSLSFEAMGDQRNTALPPIIATVARSGADRRMEFTLPGTGEKVIYLDKAGTNYVVLPNRKQYAELNAQSVGFEVRQLLMPEQIVQQVKKIQGLQMVGEEQQDGRTVTKYRYAGVANTQTQAGQVGTESFLIVDKETGLPLRSETVAQSQTGGNVQGFKGARMVTQMSDIQTSADPSLFMPPTDYAKVDSEQLKAQMNLIFSVAGQFIAQMMKSAQPAASPASPMSNTASSTTAQ